MISQDILLNFEKHKPNVTSQKIFFKKLYFLYYRETWYFFEPEIYFILL